MKYVQSFYQYPVTFSSIGKTVPARSAQGELKNIAEFSEKEIERLNNCEPKFRELVTKQKYRVLNKLPESYVPAAARVNQANEEAARLRAENEALKAKLAAEKPAETPKNAEKPQEKEVSQEEKPAETKGSKKGKK